MSKKPVFRHEVIQPLDQSYRFIPLTQGKTATVDKEDFEFLSQWDWSAIKGRNTFYAIRSAHDESKPIYMHREILSAFRVDHADGDGLNNRRLNLRDSDCSQNAWNQKKKSNNTSGFKGVTWDKNREKWITHIGFHRKMYFLGRFSTAEEAARAYDEAARRLYGEFARLNFP
jgi:hypothetical protein